MIITRRKTGLRGEKLVQEPLCPPEIQHGLNWDWTRAQAMSGRLPGAETTQKQGRQQTGWSVYKLPLRLLGTSNEKKKTVQGTNHKVYFLSNTRWFKYDSDKLWLVYSQSVQKELLLSYIISHFLQIFKTPYTKIWIANCPNTLLLKWIQQGWTAIRSSVA